MSSRSRLAVVAALVGLATVLIFASGMFSDPVAARSSGIIDYSGNPDAGEGATCSDCHSPGPEDPPTTISITGPVSVVGGETVQLTVNVISGPAQVGGLNVSMGDFAGTLIADDVETRVEGGQLTHVQPKAFTDGFVSFTFDWTAPVEAGQAVLYAAGLSANDSGGTTGDAVASATFTIDVVPPAVIGDVNCSGELNIVDALVVAQYDAGLRADAGTCPLTDSATELIVAQGDVNNMDGTNIVDALLIAQCDSNIDNGFCGNEEESIVVDVGNRAGG